MCKLNDLKFLFKIKTRYIQVVTNKKKFLTLDTKKVLDSGFR